MPENKPKFNPNQSYTPIGQTKPKFDPNKPFTPTEQSATTEDIQYIQQGRDTQGYPVVTVKEQNPIEKMFNSLKTSISEIQSPLNTIDIFGQKQTTAQQTEELKKLDPYKSLLKTNLKTTGLSEEDLQGDDIRSIYGQQKIVENTKQDIDYLKSANVDEVSTFIDGKKKRLENIYSQESEFDTSKPISKEGSLLSDYVSNKVNSQTEFNNIKYDLNKIAQETAFEKAPILSFNISESLKLSENDILIAAQQVGNNVINAGNNVNRVNFQAISPLDETEGGFSQLYKDNLAYTGIQAELNNTYKLLEQDNKVYADKLQEIQDLTKSLNEDPSNKALIEEIQNKIAETQPIKQTIQEKKQFVEKLNQSTFKLSAIKEQLELQKKADEGWELYSKIPTLSILKLPKATEYFLKGLSNRLLKTSGYTDVALSSLLGAKEEEDVEKSLANLQGFELFTTPTKYKTGKVLEFEKGKIFPKVDLDLALPMAAQQTAEMVAMGGLASAFPKSTIGKIAGLYGGSAFVFGGDILQNELNKGLSFNDALAVTAGRLGIEAATEMINPLEFIPFNGATRTLGKLSKENFTDWVGNNWKTLLPKLKAKGIDLKVFLTELGRNAGMESFEEVMSDLGNYGLDDVVINNIKPDYSKDTEFTLESELSTFFSTALTMLPASTYGAKIQLESNKYVPYLRWQAAQNSNSFLTNLDENLKSGNITPEFYEKGKKEVEKLSSLYNLNKQSIDNIEEDKKPDYLNSIYELDVVQKELLSETDEVKREDISKNIESLALKVASYDKDALKNLQLTPEEKVKKQEDVYINNIKEFTSPEAVKQASKEDLEAAKTTLQKVVDNPSTEKIAQVASEQIEKLNEAISKKEEVVSPLQQEIEKLSPVDYASQVLKLSKEQVDELETSGELEDLVSKDKTQKAKINEITSEFEEAKSLEGEELEVTLKSLALKAAEEGLMDLAQEIDSYKQETNTVNIAGEEFRVGEKVTYDNKQWEVVRVDGVGKLVSGNSTTIPSDAKSIKREETPFDLVETSVLEAQFGKQEQTPTETPSEDIEAKKADIERRRQEELEYKKNNYTDKELQVAKNALTAIEELKELHRNSKIDTLSKDEDNLIRLSDLANGRLDDFGEKLHPTNIWDLKSLQRAEDFYKSLIDNSKDKINAKYDAELAALAQPKEVKVDEETTEVIETTITETKVVVENPIEENTPVTGTEEAKEEAKQNKRQLDNPVNPFRNTFYNKETVFGKVISRLFNVQDLEKAGYYVSVMSWKDIPFEQLSKKDQDFYSQEKNKDYLGKYLVITNKEGKALEFTPEGELTKEKGAWAIEVFPQTKSETELKDGKFERTNQELKAQNKTREWFLGQVKKIFEARKAKDIVIYNISKIHQGGYEISTDKPLSIKQSIGNKKAIVSLKGGKAYFQLEGETTPNEINRPKFTQQLVDTIVFLTKNKGVNLTDTKERQQFVAKLVGENFYRAVDGKKVALQFDFDKGLIIPKIKYEGQKDFTPIDETKFRDILSKITPNIDKLLLEANLPFNFYTYTGKKVDKKVYNSYSDFIIDNFNTYSKITKTEVKPEYYLEVGEPVDSPAQKIEEATEQKLEVEKHVEKVDVKLSITNESPIQEKKKLSRRKYDIGDDFNLGDILKRKKSLFTKVTSEQERVAKEWFDNSSLAKHINFRDFRSIVNSDAFATWSQAGITLWKDSKFTDLYHEAWHEFSQLYLTKEQKVALYNEAILTKEGKQALIEYAKELEKPVSELTDLEKYFAIEEMVAEDFLKYVLSNQSLILNQRPKRNSIFRKIYNFLKELFTGNVDLQTYYERLYTGNINNYKRDLDNAFFGSLNKGIELISEGQVRNLTNAETKALYKAVDSIFGKVFQASQKPITLMFEDNNVIPSVYKGILNYFKSTENKLFDLYEKSEDELEQEAIEKDINNLRLIIDNWNKIVANHKRYSSYFTITKDAPKFDEDGNLVESDDFSEDLDENNLRDSSIVKNENVSSKEAASNETLYLIATLPSYENKEIVPNQFLSFVDDVVDFGNTWDILTKNLQGTLNYDELLSKIDNLNSEYPWAEDLLKRLPDANKKLTDAEQRLKAAFLNDIGKPRVDTYEVVISERGKGLSVQYTTAAASDERKVRDKWNSNFSNLTSFDSIYIKEDEEGNTYLDTKQLYDDFKSAFPSLKTTYQQLDKNKLFNERLDFLSQFGIEFSDKALSSEEFFKTITDFNSLVEDLFKLTSKLSEEFPASYNPFSDFGKLKLTREDKGLEYFSKVLPKIIAQELKYSDVLFTQSVKNAEQNTVWQIRQWSYISKVYNAISDVNKYPSYSDFVSSGWLKQFDINSNPYVNGVFLNTIFDLSTGERRKDKNDNYVTITLEDYNGVRTNLSEGAVNEGKTTTGLTDFEKIVQNFNTLLLYGVQEHLRYGDKSSSFATRISHVYNPITKSLENRSLIVPIDSFVNEEGDSVTLPSQAFSHLLSNLKVEMLPMKMNYESGFGSNWKYYRENIKDFGIFEGILSKEIKEKLIKEYVQTKDSDATEVLKSLQKEIKKDIETYLKKEKGKLDKILSNNLLSKGDFIDSQLSTKGSFDQLKLAYVVNSLLYNIEHTKLITGDPRFYKAKGGKKDPFKRFSQFTATGNLFVVDEQTNDYIQSKGRAIKDAVAKKLGITIAPKTATGMINSVVFTDAKYDSKALISQYTEYFKSKGYSEEQIKTLLEKYEDITEADGQGYVTLDEYRESKLRAGSSHWTKAHEDAYQKEAAFLRGERIQGMSEQELALFVPQKWQYSGTTLDGNYTVPIFYKFSVAPLIPSMIKGTSFEEIHDNLVRQNVGLALFESGSKHSAITSDGKFNSFYSDYSQRTPYTGDYTINPIFYNYLKEQVNVEPQLKGKVTFSTQMRKLLHLNLFKEGKPIVKNAAELEKRFADAIENLISLEKENVIKRMGATFDGKNYSFDHKKLQEFFQEEFEKRGLPDEVIDYFQVGENGKFTYPLDASNRRDKIEKIIYSIANKKLVQQKINGEALIQLAATGFELNQDKLKEVKEDAGLPFYRVVDGKTQAMKVKIAFSDKWKPLLKLKHPDNQPINTLDRLNEAIKDEKWLKENYKKITIVGVRIPVQGLNSQEFMEVYHFLPESAGNVIVVSPYLVAKSGGDFDIDKLTTFFPNLNEEGNLYSVKSEEQLKKEYNSLMTEYKEALKNSTDEATDKLIAAIFKTTPEKLAKAAKKELIEDIFGKSRIPSFEEYKNYELKKAYENEIVSLMRETLELEENFEQLISPNSTDLLEPFAQMLKEKTEGTWTELVEFAEIARQFKSNLVGKSNLGIAAVWNTFFALSQRGGLTLNSFYEKELPYVKDGENLVFRAKIPVRINMPHNQTSEGNISLSGLMDVENKHKISKIFEQAINGFVDVAKDDWIFFINGVKEVVPTMMFVSAAGVNNENMVSFFNQPILKEYIKEIQQYKNLFLKIKNKDDYQYGSAKALQNIVSNLANKFTDVEFIAEFAKLDKTKTSEEYRKKFNAFMRFAQEKAAENKELFTAQSLRKSVFEGEALSPEENVMILAHFEELKKLAGEVTNLQRSLNADTKKASNSFSIYDRRQKLKEVYETKLFPEEPLKKMFNESTIKAFTNTKTGFDAFAGDLFKNLLEITNHPVFNAIIRELIQKDNELKFEYKNFNTDKIVKTIKNDFITYLYQNNVFNEDSFNTVFKSVQDLFKPKNALAKELVEFKRKYPELVELYPILDKLGTDKTKDGKTYNIKLKSRLSDRDELNSAVYQIRQLLQFSNPDFTQEQQLEIQDFTKKFVKFAIIQSGLNPSVYNLMDLIPNEEYTKGIAPFINEFFNILNTNSTSATREIKNFYRRFKVENPSFYSLSEDFDDNLPKNLPTKRVKNYSSTSALDLTGKKEEAKTLEEARYIENLPSKTSILPNTNSATIKNNPNSLVLVENNKQLTATKGLKETNFSSIITKEAIGKSLLDSNLPQNQQLIDNFIKEIIEKSKNYTNIVFNEKGYGQHLLPENKRTFDYLSNQLYTYFGYQNPNFTPVNPTEVITTELTSQQSEAIDFVWEQTPELKEIFKGDKVKYQEYLDSIFPNSKVKGINYHGTEYQQKFEKFDSKLAGTQTREGLQTKGFWFTYQKDVAEDFGSNVISVLLNVKNPYRAEAKLSELNVRTFPDQVESVNKAINEGYDSAFVDVLENLEYGKGTTELVVFEPEQIHILGSNKDIEKAKQFISGKQSEVNTIEQNINPKDFTNHSGGAIGSDTQWDVIGAEFGMTNNKHYWTETKTPKGNTEISKEDFEEGRFESAKAAKRNFGYQYSAMKDSRLIRNWSQVKHSDAVFAIGKIVKTGEKIFPNQANDTRVATNPSVTGGTGYAVGMAINHNKPTYVYNQTKGGYEIGWYKWDNTSNDFVKVETPTLTKNFAGIGTREINDLGKQAIRNVYEKTFKQSETKDVNKSAEQIYSQLGNKTKSENIVIKPWSELKDAKEAILDKASITPEELKTKVDELVKKAKEKLESLPNNEKEKYIIGFHGGRLFDKPDRKKQYTGEFRNPDIRRIAESMGSRYEGLMLFYTEEIEEIGEVVFKEGSGIPNIPAKTIGTYEDAAKSALKYALNYGDDNPTLYAYLIKREVADYSDKGVGEVGVSYDNMNTNKISKIGQVSFERKESIISTRIPNSNKHFGNPFSNDREIIKRNPDLIQVSNTQEAVENYIGWILGGGIPYSNVIVETNGIKQYERILPERREWIREQLKSGKLKGLPILYYKELGEPSHATALDYLINKYDWNKETKNVEQNVKGIEINSYQTGLGNDLTNVHYANSQYPKSKYPIVPTNKDLKLTQAAKSKWGESVEAWYKSNNAQTKGIPEGEQGDKYDFDLMVGLIADKLTQYPNLVQQINERGGLVFLQKSTHTMGTGRWSSKNPKNMFMSSLIQAYKNVVKQSETKDVEVKESKEDINKEDIDNLPDCIG